MTMGNRSIVEGNPRILETLVPWNMVRIIKVETFQSSFNDSARQRRLCVSPLEARLIGLKRCHSG